MATSEQEVLHEVKKWMPHLQILTPVSLRTQSHNIALAFVHANTY